MEFVWQNGKFPSVDKKWDSEQPCEEGRFDLPDIGNKWWAIVRNGHYNENVKEKGGKIVCSQFYKLLTKADKSLFPSNGTLLQKLLSNPDEVGNATMDDTTK